MFYLRRGKVRLTVTSKYGKEAIVAIPEAGEFFGEGCLAGQSSRKATATAMTDCTLDRIGKSIMTRMIHERQEFSELLLSHLLSRSVRFEADLVEQLLSSSERRLARILLQRSHLGKESRAGLVLRRVSQADLAQMVGTSRSRVRFLMNKFKKLGFIDYVKNDRLTVHNGLLGVVLHE